MSRQETAVRAVIDTNVWLDLFWFRDASAGALAHALQAGTLLAVRSAQTDEELRLVLARPQFLGPRDRDAPGGGEPEPIRAWRALAHPVECGCAAPWQCRDPDDQKFLDLAVSAGARLLFTKDRALLALARRARAAGLCITPASGYRPGDSAGPGIGTV